MQEDVNWSGKRIESDHRVELLRWPCWVDEVLRAAAMLVTTACPVLGGPFSHLEFRQSRPLRTFGVPKRQAQAWVRSGTWPGSTQTLALQHIERYKGTGFPPLMQATQPHQFTRGGLVRENPLQERVRQGPCARA